MNLIDHLLVEQSWSSYSTLLVLLNVYKQRKISAITYLHTCIVNGIMNFKLVIRKLHNNEWTNVHERKSNIKPGVGVFLNVFDKCDVRGDTE